MIVSIVNVSVDSVYLVVVECLRPASPRLYFSDRIEFVPDSACVESKQGSVLSPHPVLLHSHPTLATLGVRRGLSTDTDHHCISISMSDHPSVIVPPSILYSQLSISCLPVICMNNENFAKSKVEIDIQFFIR